MITFLMAFRSASYDNEQAFDNLLYSMTLYMKFEYELLIKIDNDDFKALSFLQEKRNKYPFIRWFLSHRWEGRYSINYFYTYLFTYRRPDYKYVGLLTDDVQIIRNFEEDLDNKYLIFGNFQHTIYPEALEIDYKTNCLDSSYICSYPIINAKLIEITSGFGFSPNPDSWLAILNIMMYQKYKIILAKHIKAYLQRYNIDRIDNYGDNFNCDLIISDSDMCKNQYFYKLTEKQVDNIWNQLH